MLFHANKEKGVRVKTRKRDDILKLLAKAEAYESTIAQKGLTKAQLSRKQGTSRARMTQIMNLLKLTPEIRDYIKNLKDPDQIKFFTERKLRKIASIKGNQVQLKNFEELKRKAVI